MQSDCQPCAELGYNKHVLALLITLHSTPSPSSSPFQSIKQLLNMPFPLASHILASILSFELLLGGQARLPFSPTPQIQKIAMSKADGLKDALPFVPLNAVNLTQLFGVLMCLASLLVAVPATRARGLLLSGSISLVWWYSHVRMGVPCWLPVVNTGLAGVIWWIS